jgi:type I restriction enzyme S subunit
MAGLNMGIIREMPIPLAPVDLQEVFAEKAEAVGRVKVGHCSGEAALDALFACLQHRAFRGEL